MSILPIFANTEKQISLSQEVKDFASEYIEPIADEIDHSNRYPEDVVRKMGDAGLLGIPLPAEFGGRNGSYFDILVVIDQLARFSGSFANILGVHTLSSLCCINKWGNAEQKKKYLPAMANGSCIGAFAISEENAGSDVRSIQTTAVSNGDSWIINGSKTFVTSGTAADLIVVLANVVSDDKDCGNENTGMSAFLVDTKAKGFRVAETINSVGQRGSGLAKLSFENLEVHRSSLLGKVGDGLKIMLGAVEFDRLIAATAANAIAEKALSMAIQHLKSRKQFGKSLSQQQALRFTISELAIDIHTARTAIKDGVERLERGEPSNFSTAVAKVWGAETAMKVCEKALHLMGSKGYDRSFPFDRFMRDVKGYAIAGGTSEIQKLIIARELLQ